MEIINFKKEFVERTKDNLEEIPRITRRYEENIFEVTLLINSLIGLVSLPTEMTIPHDKEFKSKCVEKLKELSVIKYYSDDEKLFRALKNAISHMNITVVNEYRTIKSIIIKDRTNASSPYHTELEFSIENLREFALFVADLHLQRFNWGWLI